ncbi:hypothetical protein [Paenibacillus massiliensis]|uniref:hypothetical protein n=1 Tax=Paenibacillus massiliensis TaxID=225917 RepID=UPI0012DD0D37|nr:hypothetical protein [Paenibacillus massiliensis]
MKMYWDETFLKLRNQQVLREKIDTTENEESWMLITTEQAVEEIPHGALVLPEGQQISFHPVPLLGGDLILHLPVSWIPETPAQQANKKPGSWTARDHEQGILLGIHHSAQELLPAQVEEYQEHLLHQIGRTQPAMMRVEQKLIPLQDTHVHSYTCVFPVMPTPCLQIGFIRSWRERSLMVSCQFKLEQASMWTPIIYAIFRTATWTDRS